MRDLSKVLVFMALMVITNLAVAATISLNTTNYGSARDLNADGVFESLSPGLRAHAQVTHFLDIYRVSRGMLEYDLSLINSPVSRAVFSFDLIGGSGPNTSLNLFGYTGDGDINLSDAYLGNTALGAVDIGSTALDYSLDVTDYVNQILLSDHQFVGFNLRVSSEYTASLVGYNNEVILSTFTNSNIFDPPTLTVTTVPLPASAWLFISGIVAVTSFTRRKKTTS